MIRGSRLVLRIYAIGLAQVAALAATLAIAREWGRGPPPPHAEERRFLIDEIAAHARNRATLDARLRELRRRTGMEVLLKDHSGNVLAGSEPERRHGPGTFKTEWSGGIALGSSPPPLRPPGGPLFAIAAVLVLVGISAVLTAAWLARPLRVLSAAARDLGAGNRVALDLASEGSGQDAAAQLSGIAGDLAELERLTNDILTSARLEVSSALPPLRVERTAAREMVEEAAVRFRALHPSETLRLENGCGDAQVDVDRMMLRRALDNLLSNAEKHGGKEQIALVAGVAGGRVTIEVRDRGAGIPPEDMKRIFMPFFRGDRSRARQTGGLGLGLLLARRILEAHRGTLEIESRVGEGTVARIRVPLAS